MNVLIIDDNKDIVEMMSKYLKINEIECTKCYDGLTGLSLIDNERFDAVLLDLAMPGYSGTDVVHALKQKNLLKKQPVIIFTASSKGNEEIEYLISQGVYSVIKKPVDPDILVGYLKNLHNADKGKGGSSNTG